MGRQTFQGLMRTTGGRMRSAINRDTGVPGIVLAQNLQGPIQLRLSSPANGAHYLGMLPANYMLTDFGVIVAAGAGTFQIDLPAYNGSGAVNLVAAATSATVATKGQALATGAYGGPYGEDRPLELTVTGVTGEFNVGLWCFPVDNAAVESE